MPIVKYFSIREDNEWEGETWFFFFPYYRNELSREMLKKLDVFLKDIRTFSIEDYCLPRKLVKLLCEYSQNERGGYMTRYNEMYEYIDNKSVQRLLDNLEPDEVFTKWYKGMISFQYDYENENENENEAETAVE